MQERLEDDAAVPAAGADDAELELARGDALDDRLRVEDVERDVQLGVALLELAEQVARARSRPGPVDAPMSKVPVSSSPLSSVTSESTCSSSASSRCAPT